MKELRGKRVARMINGLEEGGVVVSASDEAMLRAYVRGTISGRDLLAQVAQFSDLSSYQDWLRGRVDESRQADAIEVSVEQLVREVESGLRRKSAQNQVRVQSASGLWDGHRAPATIPSRSAGAINLRGR